MRLLLVAFAAIACRASDAKFMGDTIYTQTPDHPFLKGLTDRTLPRSHFQY
jgi:hypothetical protein